MGRPQTLYIRGTKVGHIDVKFEMFSKVSILQMRKLVYFLSFLMQMRFHENP